MVILNKAAARQWAAALFCGASSQPHHNILIFKNKKTENRLFFGQKKP
jgi:hypothetical protein